jgi:molybdate transport system permease protein
LIGRREGGARHAEAIDWSARRRVWYKDRLLMRSRLFLLAVVVVLTGAGGLAASPAGDRTLVVSAAVSLTEALDTVARQFEARTGIRVSTNFGGSNSLARQVMAGAPVDVFISADEDQMRALESAGRIAAGTKIIVVTNRLVVVTLPGRTSAIGSPRDLLAASVGRIAIGDPAAVPAGVYARQYFERLGLWDILQPKIVPGTSVRAALAALDAGEADAAVVYATDARVARHAVVAFEVPADTAPRIVYPAAAITGAAHGDEARAFLRSLREPAAQEVFARCGFAAPDGTAGTQAPGREGTPRGEAAVDWNALWQIGRFTLGVALAATFLMLPPAIVVAWVLARGRFFGKVILETLVSLPLVLPPVATGLILLRLLGRRGPFGALLAGGGVDIVFTWKAVVLAMAIMGFPLVVRTARAGFEQVTRRYEQVAETLGAGPARVFVTISLPLASRNVLAGALLGFSRALGEFGATIVVAGSLPGRTRTLAVAIFGYLETGQDTHAMILLGVSVIIAFAAVWISNLLVKGQG